MRLHTLLAMGLAALLATALMGPALAQNGRNDAKPKDRSIRGRVNVRINVRPQNDPEDTRVFQSWFGGQLRGYGVIDPETGERLSDVLQIVQEVNNNWIIVANRGEVQRSIMLTPRTKVTFKEITPTWTPPGLNRSQRPRGNPFVASRIRPGDLVIAHGYLNANGKFVGTNIRVVGHAWGWYDDDDSYPIGYGYRGWGEVRLVDTRRHTVEVRANIGYITLTLARDGRVEYRGRDYSIDNLEKGDRVVFYYRQDRDDRSIEAYRIVALEGNQSFPRGDEYYWCDPSGNDRGDNRDQYKDADGGDWSEGYLDYIDTGSSFNKIVLRMKKGQPSVFFMPKSMRVVDQDGTRISIESLRDGEMLRVYYTNMDGTLFALKIVCR